MIVISEIRSVTCSLVGSGVERSVLDTADTLTVSDGELDVALVTPGGVPRVLDEPVVKTGGLIGAIADSEDGVIESSAAVGGVEDTGGVGLEDHLVGLDGDSERLLLKGGLHLGGGSSADGGPLGDIDGSLGEIVVEALGGVITLTGGVGVDALELSHLSLVVLEGEHLVTTVAAEVLIAMGEVGAVNELLLGEAKKLTAGDVVSTFEGTSRGEGPA